MVYRLSVVCVGDIWCSFVLNDVNFINVLREIKFLKVWYVVCYMGYLYWLCVFLFICL